MKERCREQRLGIQDLVPHKRTSVRSVASRRVHFNPLTLSAGIHSFTYSNHVDEETASGPLYAIGSSEGDGGDEAMQGVYKEAEMCTAPHGLQERDRGRSRAKR